MKRTATCDKCGHQDIIHVPGESHSGLTDSGANISLGKMHGHVAVDRYVCGNCGFIEFWVQPEEIEKLRLRYQNNS
jgi:predicted nucleic-acid-binding Zn-ribbon protein